MTWDYNNDDNVIDLGTIEVNASSDDIVFHDDPFMTDDGDIYMTDNGDIYMSDPSYYYDPFAFSYATPV